MSSRYRNIPAAIIGHVIGDAVGVPYEFKARSIMQVDPATDMIGWGTHHQPPGTWSDDSSMMLCTAQQLMEGYDAHALAQKYLKWYREGYMTAHGKVFDIGNTTRSALSSFANSNDPFTCGARDTWSNGNGALMRCLPVPLMYYGDDAMLQKVLRESCGITHNHEVSHFCSRLFSDVVRALLAGYSAEHAYHECAWRHRMEGEHKANAEAYREPLSRFLSGKLGEVPEGEIRGSGYVVHTLEAAVWCLLHSTSYKDAVLKAVNFGEDTDTTAAVTGGLAGLYYGPGSIPEFWLQQLAAAKLVTTIANDFYKKVDAQAHHCPVCGDIQQFFSRYPKAVCNACYGLAMDGKGRELVFYNTGLSGGYKVKYADTGEEVPGNPHECYVRGRLCYADEARFGGIVIELAE